MAASNGAAAAAAAAVAAAADATARPTPTAQFVFGTPIVLSNGRARVFLAVVSTILLLGVSLTVLRFRLNWMEKRAGLHTENGCSCPRGSSSSTTTDRYADLSLWLSVASLVLFISGVAALELGGKQYLFNGILGIAHLCAYTAIVLYIRSVISSAVPWNPRLRIFAQIIPLCLVFPLAAGVASFRAALSITEAANLPPEDYPPSDALIGSLNTALTVYKPFALASNVALIIITIAARFQFSSTLRDRMAPSLLAWRRLQTGDINGTSSSFDSLGRTSSRFSSEYSSGSAAAAVVAPLPPPAPPQFPQPLIPNHGWIPSHQSAPTPTLSSAPSSPSSTPYSAAPTSLFFPQNPAAPPHPSTSPLSAPLQHSFPPTRPAASPVQQQHHQHHHYRYPTTVPPSSSASASPKRTGVPTAAAPNASAASAAAAEAVACAVHTEMGLFERQIRNGDIRTARNTLLFFCWAAAFGASVSLVFDIIAAVADSSSDVGVFATSTVLGTICLIVFAAYIGFLRQTIYRFLELKSLR
ncbi:hypothetical protein DFJ73DRAFT_783327 [Zopfochytrium polystomum]|nr:hypothetical protein DFJ73DRAFT_783327 [Zopfochytrium polystomum]